VGTGTGSQGVEHTGCGKVCNMENMESGGKHGV